MVLPGERLPIQTVHSCGRPVHPHLQAYFYGGLVDTYIHYLFYNFIFVYFLDLWMQFFLKTHFNLKIGFNSPCLVSGLCTYIWVCLNVNNILAYFSEFPIGIHSEKQILLLPMYIFSVGLRGEDVWQLYLLPPDLNPDIAQESVLTWNMCFLFSVLL